MKADKRHAGRKPALTDEQRSNLIDNFHLFTVKEWSDYYHVSSTTITNIIDKKEHNFER